MVSNFNGVLLDRVDAKEIAEKLNGFFDVSKLNAMRKNSINFIVLSSRKKIILKSRK